MDRSTIPRSGPVVVVVDDSEDDRSLTLRCLRKIRPGLRVVDYAESVEALGDLTRQAVTGEGFCPDLVLLDLRMNRMDGDELARQIRRYAYFDAVPIVAVSSSPLESDVRRCLAAGCQSYVRKPLEMGDYRDILRAVLDYWLDVHLAPNRARDRAEAC